ncbi:MAG: helix-turn-helix transcriptional regulator [Dysgonomonas sp.]
MFYLFIAIIILTGICIHLCLVIGLENQFDKILLFLLFYIAVHSLHAVTVRLFPFSYIYIDKAAPFGLLYGPLLYFVTKTLRGYTLSRGHILLHAIPFLAGIPMYAVFLIWERFRLDYSVNYYSVLYGLMSLSWISYTLWALFSNKRMENTSSDNQVFPLIGAIVIMFTLAMFMIFMAFTKVFKGAEMTSSTNSEFIIFSGMLGAILFVYILLIQRIDGKFSEKNNISLPRRKNEDEYLKKQHSGDSYQKTPIRDDLMDEYLSRIDVYLDTKPYLNAQLTLDDVSQELKIPKHHLSQIFSKEYGLSYAKLINARRIEYACSLLEQANYSLKNMDEIAELSGFESRSSFYRNFGLLKGCSPSKYIEENQYR